MVAPAEFTAIVLENAPRRPRTTARPFTEANASGMALGSHGESRDDPCLFDPVCKWRGSDLQTGKR